MTDHKFTDEEVIKALEHCTSSTGADACNGCPFNEYNECDSIDGSLSIEKHALDLINRQKAEIERLQDERDGRIKSLAASIEIAEAEARVEAYILSQKAEAIKEFAERLKKNKTEICSGHGMSSDVVYVGFIDSIAKEMTEEKK